MGTELVSMTPGRNGAVARSERPRITSEALEIDREQRQVLMQYVESNMVLDSDYGAIPGTGNKRTLLKPGAEKLCDLFRCTAEYIFEEKVEDWDRPLFHYLIKCRVVSRDTGGVVAEGVGSCNSRESKYRYRNADRACPSCGAAAIKRSKFPPRDQPSAEPGWYCFAKAGGCGANFAADDPDITGQVAGKVENPDVADSANTILKMAKKRALVDATISLVRCSDMFTQDVEDGDDTGGSAPRQQQRQQPPRNSGPSPIKKIAEEMAAAPPPKDVAELEYALQQWGDRVAAALRKDVVEPIVAAMEKAAVLKPDWNWDDIKPAQAVVMWGAAVAWVQTEAAKAK